MNIRAWGACLALVLLEIPFERLIVEDAPHSAKVIYEKQGLRIMKFHAESFRLGGIR